MSEYNTEEFIAGQKACRNGDECPVGASESFSAGYSCEYQLQEIKSNKG